MEGRVKGVGVRNGKEGDEGKRGERRWEGKERGGGRKEKRAGEDEGKDGWLKGVVKKGKGRRECKGRIKGLRKGGGTCTNVYYLDEG